MNAGMARVRTCLEADIVPTVEEEGRWQVFLPIFFEGGGAGTKGVRQEGWDRGGEGSGEGWCDGVRVGCGRQLLRQGFGATKLDTGLYLSCVF